MLFFRRVGVLAHMRQRTVGMLVNTCTTHIRNAPSLRGAKFHQTCLVFAGVQQVLVRTGLGRLLPRRHRLHAHYSHIARPMSSSWIQSKTGAYFLIGKLFVGNVFILHHSLRLTIKFGSLQKFKFFTISPQMNVL